MASKKIAPENIFILQNVSFGQHNDQLVLTTLGAKRVRDFGPRAVGVRVFDPRAPKCSSFWFAGARSVVFLDIQRQEGSSFWFEGTSGFMFLDFQRQEGSTFFSRAPEVSSFWTASAKQNQRVSRAVMIFKMVSALGSLKP